jgi:hypothetical protein
MKKKKHMLQDILDKLLAKGKEETKLPEIKGPKYVIAELEAAQRQAERDLEELKMKLQRP